MTKEFAVKKAYWLLNNGYVIYFDFHCTKCIHLTCKGNLAWYNAGSSANKNTVKEVGWLMETIFKSYDYFAISKTGVTDTFLNRVSDDYGMWLATDGEWPDYNPYVESDDELAAMFEGGNK